jgi:hypothetical protein
MTTRTIRLSAIPNRQLGALYAREARDVYPGHAWADIEPLIRTLWERDRPGDWPRSRAMVHAFWRLG